MHEELGAEFKQSMLAAMKQTGRKQANPERRTFTNRVKQVSQLAREEAVRLGHNDIGTEHLLLGIIAEGEGKALAILTDLGLNLQNLKQSIDDFMASSSEEKPVMEIPFALRYKHILESAAEEAADLNTLHIGTEHLLLTMLQDRESIATQILNTYEVTYKIVRKKLTEAQA